MQKLLAFIIAKRHWFVLILCEIISFTLIYRNNAYQRNTMLSSANVITGKISSVSGAILSYFDLQKVNQVLFERNSLLEMEVIRLNEQVAGLTAGKAAINQVFLKDSIITDRKYNYQYIIAGVVNNSANYLRNYITINKGAKDGIRQDMGVVSPTGLVGKVTNVSDRFSVIMPLLHVKSQTSCKILHTNFFGSLSWKGGDMKYAFLEQIPTHATFQAGDTIVTSGYSDIFPPGIIVGIVESFSKQSDDNFYSLKVRFSVDFQSLSSLYVIDNQLQREQQGIEREARKND